MRRRPPDVRIAVAGSVDCGKSTLVAVLTRGSGGRPALDCGRGTARMSVLRHKHEIQTGRTSSLATTILGYDQGGRVLNYLGATSALTPAEISAAADKVRASESDRARACALLAACAPRGPKTPLKTTRHNHNTVQTTTVPTTTTPSYQRSQQQHQQQNTNNTNNTNTNTNKHHHQ